MKNMFSMSGNTMPQFSLFVLVMLFLEQIHCQTIARAECGIDYPRSNVNYRGVCTTVNDTGQCEIRNLEMGVGKNPRKVDVSFNVTSRNCSLYKFELKVNDSIDEMHCVEQSKKNINTLVAKMDVDLLGPSQCKGITYSTGEVVNVTFHNANIPRGCGKLHYCIIKSNASQICKEMVKYLNTTNIAIIQGRKPDRLNITPQANSESKEVGIALTKYPRFEEMQLSLTLAPSDPYCNSSNSNLHTIWMVRDINGNLMCKRSKSFPEIKQENAVSCYEDTEKIRCEFKDIPIGRYCIYLIIRDPCCSGLECNFHQTFEMKNVSKTTTEHVPVPFSVTSVALTVFAVLLFIISCVVMVFICRRRWNSPQRVVIADDDHSWLQSPEILLLYPRDCKVFMDMMATWRKVLEDKTGCNVYDNFDPHYSEELSRNKMDWVRRHVLRHNMKIVVVETPCATVIQRAIIQNSRVTYRDPTWLDNLFPFALKLLTDNFDRNNYQRVFVACFEGFTGERDSLNSLTPYIRYTIPQHLGLLLKHLNTQNVQGNAMELMYDEKENLQRLENDLKNLISYRDQNPDYLQQLLYIA